MICFSLLRLIDTVKDKQAVAAIALVGMAVLGFWLFGSNLKGAGYINLVIFFLGVVSICVFAGVPIAFAFALATFGFLALTTRVPMLTLVGRMDEGM
jgi:hypothetical protein